MNEHATNVEEWSPEFLVRVYRGDQLVEQRYCENAETVARIVESWEARTPPEGERIVVEPHPPEVIIRLLRSIADALEQERPIPMPHPFPHFRLQLVTDGTGSGPPRRGELRLLWQEQAHPGD